MADGFPLTGVDPNDPIPGIIREIRFQQGTASGSGDSRPVVIIANKVSSGSEALDTLGLPIVDQDDVVARAGYRSEAVLMYRKYVRVDPDATIYMICPPEGGSATASSCTFTFTSNATLLGVVQIFCMGEEVDVTVNVNDTPTTIGANVAAAINAQIFWPVTATASTGVVTVVVANKGPRGDYVLGPFRVSFPKSLTTTVAKSALTSGTVDDSFTNAYAQLDTAQIYYQISAKTTLGDASAGNPAVAATDHGVGEHAAFVLSQSLPNVGKGCLAIFGLGGTSAQACTVGLATNNVRCAFFHAKAPEWTPAMIAAHCGAVKRSKEIAHPGANLTNYGLKGNDVFDIPDPYLKSNRISKTEARAELNNGVSPIGHTTVGKSYLIRQITSACQVNGQYDYRAREGHIPSCTDFFWDSVFTSYSSQMQDFVGNDLVKGEKPLENTQYPNSLADIIKAEIDRAMTFGGGPYLDPSRKDEMKNSVQVRRLNDGLSARANVVSVVHNNKGQFLLLESSAPY